MARTPTKRGLQPKYSDLIVHGCHIKLRARCDASTVRLKHPILTKNDLPRLDLVSKFLQNP